MSLARATTLWTAPSRSLGRGLRAYARLTCLVPWSVATALVIVLGTLPALALGRLPTWRARAQRVWARGMTRLCGLRVSVVGRPPRGGSLLVSNHVSYLDVIVLASQLDGAFVAKSEVASWPVIGWLARSGGTLFVERGRRADVQRVGGEMARRLARGEGLLLFPEGTSSAGETVLPFRSALLEPCAAGGLPVHAAAIGYATGASEPPAARCVAWWGDMPFLSHALDLLRLERIEARLAFASAPLVERDRKLLAARLRAAVQSLLTPTR
jgi:1-acyl-sn-glycerol-3-phosphate acyltransferase